METGRIKKKSRGGVVPLSFSLTLTPKIAKQKRHPVVPSQNVSITILLLTVTYCMPEKANQAADSLAYAIESTA